VPYSLAIDHENRRVTCVGHGVVTFADIAQYISERLKHGAYNYAQLIDARFAAVDFPPRESLSAAVMEARRHGKAGPVPPTAILAVEGTVNFGFARQFAIELGFSNACVEVFTNEFEAQCWLAGKTEAQGSVD
jgi:hypothetical protein